MAVLKEATFYISGREVKSGQVIADFRGDDWVFLRVSRLPTPPSTGRVEVRRADDDHRREFFPSVFKGYIRVPAE